LQGLGYLVIEAEDGAHGIACTLAEQPDLIIMDLSLPGMTGIDVAAMLQQNSDTSHIPIIALTGWDSDERKQRALSFGIKAYLVKPAPFETLKKTIENFLT
jgi:CheY-like chemotaxis protein